MAAGRGQFYRSLLEGLERQQAQQGPGRGAPSPDRGRSGPGRGTPGPDRGRSGPDRGTPGPTRRRSGPGKRQTGGRKRWKPPRAARSSASGKDDSHQASKTEAKTKSVPEIKTSPSKENLLERLPSEILIKILLYLDASSLFCISHVSKLFHQLANDDVIWQKLYMSEFRTHTWKPKSADDAALKFEPEEAEERLEGHWKKLYFRTKAGHKINMWRRELRDISSYTGLPRRTEWVLRNLQVSWQLALTDSWKREFTLTQSQVFFFQSSVFVCWSKGVFPKYHHVTNIQLHGVRQEPMWSADVSRPGWRSLIVNLDVKRQPQRLIGIDRLVKLVDLSHGFIIGIWRGQQRVAFVMASLHFHKLVEKSFLGSPVCPYSEPEDPPPVDNSDPEVGLHGYSLHFVLHNTGTEILSVHFSHLSFSTVQIKRGLLVLRVIDKTNLSQHRSLTGNISLPWKSESLGGSVEKCCIVTLTLLDEFQKLFWCVSSPVCLTVAKNSLSLNYSGEHFQMEYRDPEGKVKMTLVWLEEQKQFLLIGLTVYVPVFKVNKHFSRQY